MNFLDFLGFRASDIEPMTKHRKRINEKNAAKKCLLCDEPQFRRELCSHHTWLHRIEMLQVPKERRHVHEIKKIRLGLIGASRQGQGGGRKRKKGSS